MDKAAHLATAGELSGMAGMSKDMTLTQPSPKNPGMRGVEANTARSKGTPMGAPTGITQIQYSTNRVPVVDAYDTYEDEMN